VAISYGKTTVTTVTGTLSPNAADNDSSASFTGLSINVPKNDTTIVTIKANTNSIANGAVTGDAIKLGFDSVFKAVSASGTTDILLAGAGADVYGSNTMYLRKSKLLVAAATADTKLQNESSKLIHAFTVTADSAGPITVKKFSWDVNVGDIDAGGELKVDNWKVYKSGSSTALAGLWSNGTTTSTDGVTPQVTNGSKTIIVELDSEVEIAAGESKTFSLKAKIQGVEEYDSLSVSLNNANDTTVLTGGLSNSDLEGAQIDDGTTQTKADLLWSDKASGVDHKSTMQSTYKDWTNGYLINTFPISNSLSQ